MADPPPPATATAAAEGQTDERNGNGSSPTNGVLPGSSSPFSSRSTSANSCASSPRKQPPQPNDLSSRRGSLSSVHRDPSKPVKPTSSFPVPQQPQQGMQVSPDPPVSPARMRASLRSPRDAPAGGAFSSPKAASVAAAAAATAVPVPAALSNGGGEALWPLSSSSGEGPAALQSMLPPSAINAAAVAAAGSVSPAKSSSSQGFSMPLTSRLSPAASASVPLPPAALAYNGSFVQQQQAQAYTQQLMLAQQQQQQQQQHSYPDSARQLFPPALPAQTHAMHSVYLQRLHEEVMDPQQRFMIQQQQHQQQQLWQQQQQVEFEQQQQQQQQSPLQPQQQQRRHAPANVLIPRASYAPTTAYLNSQQVPSMSPPLLSGAAAVSASPLVYHNHVQAGSRDDLAEAEDDEEEPEGEDSEGGYAIRPGRGRRRRGSSSSDGDGSPSEHRERIAAMAGGTVAAVAAVPAFAAANGSSQHPRVGFAVGSDSSEDLHALRESTTAGLMRKAQSAADFKSFSSNARRGVGRNRGADIDLGVLTPFYSIETGTFVATAGASGSQPHSGGLGASANASSSSLTTLRASISHAVLSSAATRGGGASSRGSANTAPGAPLVAHFSLGGGSKYNGQVRGQRRELAMVTEKLREMAYEVSRLHRKIKEYEEESEQWSLRYSRRLVILSNLALGGWIFLLQLMDGIKARAVVDSWLNRLFIPSSVFAASAAATSAAVGAGSAATAAAAAALAKQTGVSLSMATSIATAAAAKAAGVAGGAAGGALGGAAAMGAAAAGASSSAAPLSAVLISGFLTGVQSSLWFLLSAALQMKSQGWKRNTGFALSTSYSLFLILFRRGQFRPASANVVNILANLVYIAARYYFLHGLLVFNSMRIL